ncbi:uncharacterized protein LY79DRAFT_555202 [Colletotrichum navitas]|uniref:Uncharacterized protein n=1 Tax=Colletotrichum navitas TaxID=681940 RepID=A0AAD8PYZ1_9PEZI|nr:uncharacterized protein LY79DRAFT_555202 [Colletotrichum navitas]KAK1590139.1 hypothetical protein LY79DRAFT_555202 [Colletotrichum navitas]
MATVGVVGIWRLSKGHPSVSLPIFPCSWVRHYSVLRGSWYLAGGGGGTTSCPVLSPDQP